MNTTDLNQIPDELRVIDARLAALGQADRDAADGQFEDRLTRATSGMLSSAPALRLVGGESSPRRAAWMGFARYAAAAVILLSFGSAIYLANTAPVKRGPNAELTVSPADLINSTVALESLDASDPFTTLLSDLDTIDQALRTQPSIPDTSTTGSM